MLLSAIKDTAYTLDPDLHLRTSLQKINLNSSLNSGTAKDAARNRKGNDDLYNMVSMDARKGNKENNSRSKRPQRNLSNQSH
mmetsp:Transcript_8776/g.7755  ORF Transcript_8776/g.7755 Transcript_8776/m.7755 type:complete len:82 (-) Transcript_8776:125-370(-)